MPGTLDDILYDPEDEAIVKSRKWHISDTGYAVWRGRVNGKNQTIRLHRLINNTPDGLFTDHKNHNKLDNRRANLRTVTQKENMSNYRGEKGYTWDKSKGKWLVRYKGSFYGRYLTEEDARQAYRLAKSGVLYSRRERRQRYYLPKGVFKNKGNRGYQARVQKFGRRVYLGTFNTIEQAKLAYEKERITS